MKKLKIVVISLLLFVLAFSVTGCYSVVPQKMWRVKGTYRLTNYSFSTSGVSVDYLEQKEIVAYLVVTGKSEGYYIYQDKDTPATMEKVNLYYEYSTEEPDKVAYVTFKEQDALVGKKLGVQKKRLKGYEGSQIIVEILGQSTSNVDYTWDKECFLTNLWWVNIKMGTNFKK